MIRKISKTNMNQLDLHGSESWEPLIAVLIRPNKSEAFVADDLRGVFTADELREIAKHLDQVNHA
jgi:tRNA(Ile2) C34 agmatinyltransferase TiaS